MRYRPFLLLLAVSLPPIATPTLAEGRWCLSLSAGESVSSRHGSALDAALFAELSPLIGLGLETGFAYMNAESHEAPIRVYPLDVGADGGVGALTDGITRNRGYYLGPALKLGSALYAVASAGLYEFSDNSGDALGSRWGASAGFGLSGPGRFEPRGELRYRWARDGSLSASAFLITLGFHIR